MTNATISLPVNPVLTTSVAHYRVLERMLSRLSAANKIVTCPALILQQVDQFIDASVLAGAKLDIDYELSESQLVAKAQLNALIQAANKVINQILACLRALV